MSELLTELHKEKAPDLILQAERLLSGYRHNSPEASCLKASNILHLLDLKRAGHSPTDTELDLMPIEKSKRIRNSIWCGND